MRLFFALPVPSEAKERLRPPLDAARQAGEDGVSFTKVEQLHFTLAFLGEQPGPQEALAAGESLRGARGVGAGVSGAAGLREAAERLRSALRQSGFGIEDRKFRPHLTFGRVRPRGERFAKRELAAVAPGEFARWTAREASLLQSVLGKGGASHTVLRTFPFK